MGQPERTGGAGRHLESQIVAGDDRVEGRAPGLGDDALHRPRHIGKSDMNALGDAGDEGMLSLGGDHQACAEGLRSRLISRDTVALVNGDQENARGRVPLSRRRGRGAARDQPQPPPAPTAAPQAPQRPLPPVAWNTLLNTKVAPVSRAW